MMFYCFTDQDISIAAMSRMVPFNSVSQKVLEYWSATDNWQERRRQAREEMAAKVQEQIGDLLVKQRIEQLGHIEKMERQVREILESGTLEFRSYEGGINAFVRLAQFEDQLIEKILGELPSHKAEPREPPRTCSLTDEEKMLAVKAVLESRRKQAREKQDSPEPVPA